MEQALAFTAGPTRYAMRLADVEQVLPRQSLRELPGSPPGVVGLLAWRGAFLPTVDLGLLIAGQACRDCIGTRIIIAGVHGDGTGGVRRFGLLAERVFDVIRLDRLVAGMCANKVNYLGDFVDVDDRPQLLRPDILLRDILQEVLSTRQTEAGDGQEPA